MTIYEDVRQAYLACRRSAGAEVAAEIISEFGGDLELVDKSKWSSIIERFESAAESESRPSNRRARTIKGARTPGALNSESIWQKWNKTQARDDNFEGGAEAVWKRWRGENA